MNRQVVITGASRGLGLSLAKKLVEAGDSVLGLTKTRNAWKAAKAAVSGPGSFQLFAADLTKEPAVKSATQFARSQFGRVDILINNAGYGGKLQTVEKLPLKEFQKSFEANLVSAFLVSKYFLPLFQKQKAGTLINISSMAGTRAVPRLFAYSAAKFGIMALTQCIAKENEGMAFKCLTVCPGGMNTEMRSSLFGKEDAAKQQSPDFVASVIMDVLNGKVAVDHGGSIIIRHGKITAIHPVPPP